MLDDLKFIHEKDTHDALGLVEKQWNQLNHSYDLRGWKPPGQIKNVVHSGMGGSALWALLSKSWPNYNVPFEVVRDYDIPPYVDENTLFIAASYSGNTEETLSTLAQADNNNAQIVVMTSGGKLEEIAKDKGYLLISLPKIDKPRYGAFYGFKALVTLAEQLGLTSKNSTAELTAAADFLKESLSNWLPTVPTDKNKAKQLALEVMGKSPVLYAGSLLAPASHKWKISFNENAKNVAWEYTFPEFNHNEFTGWTSHPVDKPYAIIYLLSSFDNERVKKRFSLSNKLLSGRWSAPEEVVAEGKTELHQLLWTVSLGDFVSLYTAFLNGVNPIDVGDKDIIEKFKKELNA